MKPIKVYGTDWCEDSHATREHLAEFNLPYQYINIDNDPAAQAWVVQQNGKQRTPTVDIDGKILTEPSKSELADVLREKGLLKS